TLFKLSHLLRCSTFLRSKNGCSATGTTKRIVDISQKHQFSRILDLIQSAKVNFHNFLQPPSAGDYPTPLIQEADSQRAGCPNTTIDCGAAAQTNYDRTCTYFDCIQNQLPHPNRAGFQWVKFTFL